MSLFVAYTSLFAYTRSIILSAELLYHKSISLLLGGSRSRSTEAARFFTFGNLTFYSLSLSFALSILSYLLNF